MGIDWVDFKLPKDSQREIISQQLIPDWNSAEVVSGLIGGRLALHMQMTLDVVDPEQMFKSESISLVFQLPTKFLYTLALKRVLRERMCASQVGTHMCLGVEICWVA